MIRHLFSAVLIALTGGLMPLFSQEPQGPEVIQAAFEVQWREGQAPVGQWNVQEGHWLDEIPWGVYEACLLYTSPSPRDATLSRMPSSA